MSQLPDVDTPLNVNEKYLYGINVRLEILIQQVSSLVDHIAKKEGIAVEEGQVEPVKTRAKRGV